MSGLLGHRGLLLQGGGGGGGGSLYDEIMADSPVHYWRNGEASGSVMVDEVAADGVYFNAVTLGNPALYPGAGAPTCAGNFSGSNYGESSVTPPALTSMTLLSVVELTSASGYQPIGPNRDNNGTRIFQWRSDGANLEFVKIVGGVATISQASVFTAGVPALIGLTIDSSGNYVMYKNGASIKSGTISAANYGGAGDPWQIGYSPGMGASLNGFICENVVFDTAISGARMAAYAAAAGL